MDSCMCLQLYYSTNTADSMMFIKVHDTENGKILALCDQILIDEVIVEDGIELNIKEYNNFYKGKLIDNKYNLSESLHSDEIISANIVGQESVSYAIDNNIIEQENIKLINSIPYAQAYKMY